MWNRLLLAHAAAALVCGQALAQEVRLYRQNDKVDPQEVASILGKTGIPTAGLSLPDAPALPDSDAFLALCRWLEDGDGPHRILALGPLTNIAALALARPDLAGRIDELVPLLRPPL